MAGRITTNTSDLLMRRALELQAIVEALYEDGHQSLALALSETAEQCAEISSTLAQRLARDPIHSPAGAA